MGFVRDNPLPEPETSPVHEVLRTEELQYLATEEEGEAAVYVTGDDSMTITVSDRNGLPEYITVIVTAT